MHVSNLKSEPKRRRRFFEFFKKNWFLLALLSVCTAILADTGGRLADAGNRFKSIHGTDIIVFLIFLASGLVLKAGKIREGVGDIKGTVISLSLIFVAAPLTAYAGAFLPIDSEIKIGLFLVAIMPSTLSSGVVMTGASGGNMAHALLITIIANAMSIFTIPLSLAILLGVGGEAGTVPIQKGKIMLQIAFLVLMPLVIGLMLRPKRIHLDRFFQQIVPVVNQCMILAVVWMALSGAKEAVVNGGNQTVQVFLLSFIFHGVLLAFAFISAYLFRIGPGRRESIIFMGGQKTLPLSVLL
ncbi:MAG: bile acid:sodium symporter, partial [Thermodesulfobacteriota bacterium]